MGRDYKFFVRIKCKDPPTCRPFLLHFRPKRFLSTYYIVLLSSIPLSARKLQENVDSLTRLDLSDSTKKSHLLSFIFASRTVPRQELWKCTTWITSSRSWATASTSLLPHLTKGSERAALVGFHRNWFYFFEIHTMSIESKVVDEAMSLSKRLTKPNSSRYR